MRCDCCQGIFVDEVALLMIEDAILVYRDALTENEEHARAAWQEAELKTTQALAAATKGQG